MGLRGVAFIHHLQLELKDAPRWGSIGNFQFSKLFLDKERDWKTLTPSITVSRWGLRDLENVED